MKTRALVENGTNTNVSIVALEIQLISKSRDSLIIERTNQLRLVGRLQADGSFVARGKNDAQNPKQVPKYMLRLNPRIVITEDGRVFYDITRADPTSQDEHYELGLFLNEQFGAYGIFEERFDRLYQDFKSIN